MATFTWFSQMHIYVSMICMNMCMYYISMYQYLSQNIDLYVSESKGSHVSFHLAVLPITENFTQQNNRIVFYFLIVKLLFAFQVFCFPH